MVLQAYDASTGVVFLDALHLVFFCACQPHCGEARKAIVSQINTGKGNTREMSEKRGAAHIGFPERIDSYHLELQFTSTTFFLIGRYQNKIKRVLSNLFFALILFAQNAGSLC